MQTNFHSCYNQYKSDHISHHPQTENTAHNKTLHFYHLWLYNILCDIFNSARLHTRQNWLKSGSLPTAVISLVKMHDIRTRLTSALWATMSGELCWTLHFKPKMENIERKCCSWHGTSCHRTRSTNRRWTSRKDFGLARMLWWTLRTWLTLNVRFGICNSGQCLLTVTITVCCRLFRAHF